MQGLLVGTYCMSKVGVAHNGLFVAFLCCNTATSLNDHWKVAFEFYIKWCEYGYSGSMLLRYANVHYPSTEWSKYSNCTVNFSKYGKIRDTLLSSSSSMLNSLLLSGTDSIINAHDPMQNPGQIYIFYEPGQTHFT